MLSQKGFAIFKTLYDCYVLKIHWVLTIPRSIWYVGYSITHQDTVAQAVVPKGIGCVEVLLQKVSSRASG